MRRVLLIKEKWPTEDDGVQTLVDDSLWKKDKLQIFITPFSW